MLCSERIMGDLLGRFQLGRASYELKSEEAEAIRAKFTTAPGPLGNVTCPTQLLTSAKSASEYTAWKVCLVRASKPGRTRAQGLKLCKTTAALLTHDSVVRPTTLQSWRSLRASPDSYEERGWQCFWTMMVKPAMLSKPTANRLPVHMHASSQLCAFRHIDTYCEGP